MMRFRLGAAFLLGLFPPGAGWAWAAIPASELIPAQMAQTAPFGMVKLFLLLTFFIHIVLVNILLGSSVLASINAWRARPFEGYNLKSDTGFTTGVLALAVNFGVAPFLFAQVAYGSFLYTSIVLMSVWWLAVPLMVMLAYYALYIIKAAEPDGLARRRVVIGANTVLLMLIAFLLATNASLAMRPEAWRGWLDSPGGIMLNLGDPTFTPRYLHILAASVAVGGLFLAVRARWSLRRPDADKAMAAARIKYGLNTFVYASLAQALAGVWYLFSLPAEIRAMFLGGSLLATGALVLVLLGLAAALWAARQGMTRLTSAFTLGIIFIMVLVRDLVRNMYLAPYAQQNVGQGVQLPNPAPSGQGFAFALFILCTALGVTLLFWMLRVAVKTFNGAAEDPGAGKGE